MSPRGPAIGDFDGDALPDVFVADTGNNRILVFAGVPEPSTMLLVGMAMAGAGAFRWPRRKA